jgi:hypothetical protein
MPVFIVTVDMSAVSVHSLIKQFVHVYAGVYVCFCMV